MHMITKQIYILMLRDFRECIKRDSALCMCGDFKTPNKLVEHWIDSKHINEEWWR